MRIPAIQGFTLIELMVAVAIICILSAIAVPTFAHVLRKSQESTTKGSLAVLRSVIAIYYTDHEGQYPTDNLASLVPVYLAVIPPKRTPPYHPEDSTVGAGTMAQQGTSDGGWYYYNSPGEELFGKVIVNCNHQDMNGVEWDLY